MKNSFTSNGISAKLNAPDINPEIFVNPGGEKSGPEYEKKKQQKSAVWGVR